METEKSNDEKNRKIHVENQIPDSKFLVKITTDERTLEFEELKNGSYKITTTDIRKIECNLESGIYEYLYSAEILDSADEFYFLIVMSKGESSDEATKPIIYINDYILKPKDSNI